MQQEIRDLRRAFEREIELAKNCKELSSIRVSYLGKKGPVQAMMRLLRSKSFEERPLFGQQLNDLKKEMSCVIDRKFARMEKQELAKRLSRAAIDVTLPGRRRFCGIGHPLTQMLNEFARVLSEMGFSVQHSPEIESEYYNYGGLNFPDDHPARDMQDTFYLTNDTLLRSHTTAIQQHIMEKEQPPIRVVSLGRCYRNETVTARAHVFFHQVDALYIDKQVTLADLLATMEAFYTQIFRRQVDMRVRSSYFPFVEPGI